MNAFNIYVYSSAGWLSLQGIALVAVPRIIVTLLLDDIRPPSEIETYLACSCGLGLLTISLLTIMLSGSIPLSSALAEPVVGNDAMSDPRSPYATPTLVVTSLFHGICAFYLYTWFSSTSLAAFAVGTGGYAIVATVGVWCSLFAGTYSNNTGPDKRMTGYPFKNVEADQKKKLRAE